MSARAKSLFNKKIKCSRCEGNFKLKRERKTNRYVCSNYENYKSCERVPIEEDYLVELIQKRLEVEVTREVVEEYVESIIVEDRNLVEIFIKGQESILMSKTHLRF